MKTFSFRPAELYDTNYALDEICLTMRSRKAAGCPLVEKPLWALPFLAPSSSLIQTVVVRDIVSNHFQSQTPSMLHTFENTSA
jgi:hypothetical protein